MKRVTKKSSRRNRWWNFGHWLRLGGTVCKRIAGSSIGASLTGATEALTQALAVELAPLRVNAVCLGGMQTEMWNGIPDAQRNAMFDFIANIIPAGCER